MLEKFKHHWQQFKAHEPGTRFQAQRREGRRGQRSPLRRGLSAVLAVAVTLIGLVMMPAPGPGMVVVAFGLVMLARESMMVARMLDAAELRVRPPVLRLMAWWKQRHLKNRP